MRLPAGLTESSVTPHVAQVLDMWGPKQPRLPPQIRGGALHYRKWQRPGPRGDRSDLLSGRHQMRNVACILGLLGLTGCYHPPKETQLIQRFWANRSEFDDLLAMATADRGFRRVSGGEIPPRGMSVERYDQYLAKFRKLGIEDGLTWDLAPGPGGLFVIAGSEVPIGGRNRSEGYVYSPIVPMPLVNSLNISDFPVDFHKGSGEETIYKPLQDHWYLFYHAGW